MSLSALDTLWLLVSSALVLVMQSGFLCVEAGLTRTKNSINVAVKNLADFAISSLAYWLVGFGLMFGASRGGWFGTSDFLLRLEDQPGSLAAFFVFQSVFCGTAVTIVSGAIAERMRFGAYVLLAAFLSLSVYPVFGHWAWGGALGGERGWLARLGFVDFAGSTVVHSVGGWAALAAVIVVGPRDGRFPPGGRPREVNGSSLPLAMLGVILLWFGWLGFNGGSALALTDDVPRILANTLLAGCAGMAAQLALGRSVDGYIHPVTAINGALGGLVAITAGCHAAGTLAAILIGASGACVTYFAARWMDRLRWDDAVAAVPVHLGAGVWGTLAVAFLADPAQVALGLDFPGRLAVQATGVLACAVTAFLPTWLFLTLWNRRCAVRVSKESERIGLNVSEHHVRTDLIELVQHFDRQAKTRDLSLRAPVEPFTEVGQIAEWHNRLISALEVSVTDVSSLRHTQTQLEAAKAAAETASVAKSEFLANMSHEIRTPMTAILGYADLLLDPDCDGPERVSHVQTIRANGKHLLALINDVLDLSKIESGKMTVERVPVELSPLIDEVLSILDVRARERGLSLDATRSAGPPARIVTDPLRLRQVLVNLIGNAIKFTPSGGVRLIVRRGEGPETGALCFDVVDTGIGIPADRLERLFQPFVQADSSTTRRFGGTGLGLAISKHFALLLGGGLRVASQEGRGSTFTLTIDPGVRLDEAAATPPTSEPAAPLPSSPASGPQRFEGRALLAEDVPANRRLVTLLLEKLGFEVEAVEDGQQAFEAVLRAGDEGRPFRIVLLDMQMPVLDGYETARRLRERGITTPIVALTAHAMAGDRQRCLDAGCDDYASKPIERGEFLRVLGALLPARHADAPSTPR